MAQPPRQSPGEPPERPQTQLAAWVLPLAVFSVLLIGAGVISTYASTTIGALIVLVGLLGIALVGWGAARSVDDE